MKQSKRWQDILIGVGIFALFAFAVSAVCGLVCATLMVPLGFQYRGGIWDIVVFFFWGGLVSIPVSPSHAYRLL